MSQPKATTMQLPVKLVRKIARLAFNAQRERIERDVLEVAAQMNERIAKENKGLFRRIGLCKIQPLLDTETIYETWKQEFLEGKMSMFHPAWAVVWRSRTVWWKRLRQFSELPETDDDRMIAMSMEDLDLINYTFHVEQASKGQQ